jgi:superfamily I DNA/RNA helicase
MIFIPSPQQTAIFEWTEKGSGSAVVEAVAGAGKTTTLVKMLERTQGSVAFMAYNKKIAEEIKTRVAPLGLGTRVSVGTVHSFGFSALRKAYPRTRVDGKKLQTLAARINLPESVAEFAIKAVSMAKQSGIGAMVRANDRDAWYSMVDHFGLDEALPEDEGAAVDRGLQAAADLLKASNEACADLVDFDDMVYVPVMQGLRFWQNDWVLLDEAQDTNATRRALARMSLKKGGRMVAVGDPAQAIYGFTGADSDSLDLIRRDFNARTLPLTVSYRCPKSVVREAQQWVGHIQAAEAAPEGSVSHIDEATFWGTEEKPGEFQSLSVDDAILCRNTKPLIRLAYGLLRRGKGCMVEGRDIGAGLIRLTQKWRSAKTVEGLRTRLVDWSAKEIAKAVAKGNDGRADSVNDQTEALLEIMSQFPDDAPISEIHKSINSLFGDTAPGQRPRVVTLSTIHKSKGREWPRVMWWGANHYQPSPYARKSWQLQQEYNLMYVAATRAQSALVHIDVG